MSDNIAAWGVKDEGNMWWSQGNPDQQQYMQLHHQQQQQIDVATSQHQQQQQQQQQQMLNYKMANTFQNQNSNVDNTSPVGAQGMRGYDYSGMTGGNPQMNAPAQGNQWWYPPSNMDNMHTTMQQQGMQQQNNMTPAHSPSPLTSQSDTRSLQEQEANRQHQEAIQQHHQAIAEAQARHHQLQQQTQQLQHQLQQQQLLNSQQQILQQPRLTKGRMPRGAKGAGGEVKPRGRMTAYAFFVQTCREEHKKKHPEENVVFAEFSKKCAERWKTMSDKEKKRFHEMAETDKQRYDTEMQGYTPAKGEKQVRGKKRKQTKDPHAPKRSLSAFFHFSNEERSKVKGANPDWGVGDVAKELGRRWADADPDSRARFEAMADKDKARYEREMTAYKKKAEIAAQQQVPEEEVEDEEEEDEEDD